MAEDDREHFESYRRQTQIKHKLLEKYLPPFFDILKKRQSTLLYIDAFAGSGSYKDPSQLQPVPGSPIRAMTLAATRRGFAERVRFLFSENNEENYADLQRNVEQCLAEHRVLHPPDILGGSFVQLFDLIQKRYGDDLRDLPPTFLFVDPCGISGVHFASIAKIVRRPRCEALIFFNSSGVRRTVGLAKRGHLSDSLVDLYESRDTAARLCHLIQSLSTPQARGDATINMFRELLRTRANAEYVLPFRIEAEDRQDTSHYLIHASKRSLGFKIMKDIMWDLGCNPDDPQGLHLLQASSGLGPQLIDPVAAQVDEVIRQELAGGRKPVTHFIEDLPQRPHDMVAAKYYRQRLLSLEEAGAIEVMDGETVLPASMRPRPKGKATLAKRWHVRLRP